MVPGDPEGWPQALDGFTAVLPLLPVYLGPGHTVPGASPTSTQLATWVSTGRWHHHWKPSGHPATISATLATWATHFSGLLLLRSSGGHADSHRHRLQLWQQLRGLHSSAGQESTTIALLALGATIVFSVPA